MKKYIFRIIFFATVIFVGLFLSLDFDNTSFFAIICWLGALCCGGYIISKNLSGKTDSEISNILGIPESWIVE